MTSATPQPPQAPDRARLGPERAPRDTTRVAALADGFFFVLAGVAALWLTWVVARDSVDIGWLGAVYLLTAWGLLAYLALPRLHRVLTTVYVPDYFIGRARTADGLLGDPVNVALHGSAAQLRTAMEAAGWIEADPVSVRSSRKIVTATLRRRSYDSAPVSPLFLFGRQQDVAYQQEVAGNPSRRHHVRFWRCPPDWPLPGGRRVDWLAAGTYDRAVGLSLFTLQVTHKIAADTDDERDHVVATLVAADSAVEVETVRDFSTAFHSRNGGGDEIETDGDLPVVDLRAVDVPAAGGATGAPSSPVVARLRRPTATTVGALLVVLGVVADLHWVASLAEHWTDVVRGLSVDGTVDPAGAAGSTSARAVVVAVLALVAVVQVGLAWGVLLGREWPRMTVLVLAAASTTSAFVGWALSGERITLHTTW